MHPTSVKKIVCMQSFYSSSELPNACLSNALAMNSVLVVGLVVYPYMMWGFFLYIGNSLLPLLLLLLNSSTNLQGVNLVEDSARELVRGGVAAHVAGARLAVARSQST